MNYHSLFSTLSLALLLQVSSTFLLSSCSDQKPLEQNSSLTSSQVETQENLTGISKTIQDKAKQFTVRIDYPDGNGSGVIVAKNGETYYVLTAKHVVEQDQEYKLVTPDEKEYKVDAGNIKTLEGADLAVLQFQSGQMYQVATLGEYERESEEFSNKNQDDYEKAQKQILTETKRREAMSPEEFLRETKSPEEFLEESQKEIQELAKQSQEQNKKMQELQYFNPWLFLFGWQRFNNTPQLRLTAGRDFTERGRSIGGNKEEDIASFASQNFDSQARSQSYQLSYTNFSQGGMSGGPVMDTLGRVIGIHAAAEGETSGLEEIQLGFSLGVPTETVLSSISQAGIKPEWLKVEKARPPRITKADEQSITKNLLEIEPPGNNATEADWLNYGNDLWRIKRFQEASAAFDEAIKKKPDFYQAYYGKGLAISSQAGKYATKKASEFFSQESSKMGESLVPSPPKIQTSPGASYEKILQELDTSYQEIDKQSAKQLEQQNKKQAQVFSSSNQEATKALPFYKKATEINPDFYPAWREIGRIKFGELNSQKALNKSEVIALNSNPTLSPRATLAAQEALAAYNKATALNPSDSQLYFSKGSVLQDLSRHQEAIDAFTQAIKIDPSTIFYFARIKSYCAIGDKQKAEADIKSVEKLGGIVLPICPN
jgi:tetratricopeptide (TPR) repeat protein